VIFERFVFWIRKRRGVFTMGAGKKSAWRYFFIFVIIAGVCMGTLSCKSKRKSHVSSQPDIPTRTDSQESIPVFQSFDEAVAYRNKRFSDRERGRLNNKFKADGTSGDPYFDAAQSYIAKSSTGTVAPVPATPSQNRGTAVPVASTTSAPAQRPSPAASTAAQTSGVSNNPYSTANQYKTETPDPLNPSIPRYALEGAEQKKAEFLIDYPESVPDLTYRFFYNEEGQGRLEYTVSSNGTTWHGTHTWGNSTGSIGNGKINYKSTQKNDDEAEARIEERRKDPAFAEIERIVLQIATDYDYDFYGAYGKVVKYRVPTVKKAVCDGYADAVLQAFNNHPLVERVDKWSSNVGNHAWDVIVLKDGRKLYCDTTWYDSNSIDDEGYVVHVPARNPVDLTFDINEFNSSGGAINTATGKTLAVHFGWGDAKKVN
jgi:hypothetical protein